MQTDRNFTTQNCCNINIILVGIGLVLCYFVYVVQFLIGLNAQFIYIVLPISVVLYLILWWTFLAVYLTDPGNVPKFWAVQINPQQDHINRRYCLLCHNFKPERTHHCSTCGRCVLNMDHHCPWINNCVGFHNKKSFILLLFYFSLILWFAVIQQGYLLVNELIPIFKQQNSANFHTAIRILFFLFQFFIALPLTTFCAYHLNLVFGNQTTLMQLKRDRDIKRGTYKEEQNVYDIGTYNNFIQTFGENWWEWVFPVEGTIKCDGIHWPKNAYARFYEQQQTELEQYPDQSRKEFSFKQFNQTR